MNKSEGIKFERRTIGRRKETTHLRLASSAEGSDLAPTVVVFGNGAFGGYRTFGPIVKQFMQTAQHAGMPVETVMYGDPWNEDAYSEPARYKRLKRVVEYIADQRQRPVRIVGHSWSWPMAVAAGHVLHQDVDALHAYTPNGHGGEVATPVSWEALAQAAIMEAGQVDVKGLLRNPRCVASLGAAALGRVMFSHGVTEALNAFEVDVTDAVLDWHHQYAKPVGMIVPAHDAFFKPPEETLEKLQRSEIDLRFITTTHLGAVLDSSYGEDLFKLVAGINTNQPSLAPNDLQG